MSSHTRLPSVHLNGESTRSSTEPESSSPDGSGVNTITALPGNRAELRQNMLKKLRPLPLRHEWVFWHDKYDSSAGAVSGEGDRYTNSLKELADISTIQTFWQVYNNTPFESLALRDSLLLFKKNVRPVWEDSRNNKGGAWTFRVPKANNTSSEFWKEVMMMAIGEVLQEVVEKGDDICGVSTSVRFNSHLILIWNRDGSNQKSIDAILKRVLDSIPEEMKPQPQNYYYKKHSEHKGYKALDGNKTATSSATTSSVDPK